MTVTVRKITDEHGHPWDVQAKDPGRPAILALQRLGYTDVILPQVILRGILNITDVSNLFDSAIDENDTAAYLRAVRLYDCLEALRGTA